MWNIMKLYSYRAHSTNASPRLLWRLSLGQQHKSGWIVIVKCLKILAQDLFDLLSNSSLLVFKVDPVPDDIQVRIIDRFLWTISFSTLESLGIILMFHCRLHPSSIQNTHLHRLKPDMVSFSAAVSACEKGQQWQRLGWARKTAKVLVIFGDVPKFTEF